MDCCPSIFHQLLGFGVSPEVSPPVGPRSQAGRPRFAEGQRRAGVLKGDIYEGRLERRLLPPRSGFPARAVPSASRTLLTQLTLQDILQSLADHRLNVRGLLCGAWFCGFSPFLTKTGGRTLTWVTPAIAGCGREDRRTPPGIATSRESPRDRRVSPLPRRGHREQPAGAFTDRGSLWLEQCPWGRRPPARPPQSRFS